MEKEKLLEFIKSLIKKYTESEGKIEFNSEFIQKYLFIENEDGTKSINDDFYYILRANGCDMKGVSFKDVHIKDHYFNGLKNVEINIDEIPNKDLSDTYLEGVKVTGSLYEAYIKKTKFKGYIGNLVLDPQKVKDKDLYFTDLDGITIDGSFDDCNICMIKFKGAKGIIRVNPQRVKNKDLSYVDFDGVELIGNPIQNTNNFSFKKPCFNDCILYKTDFSNCKGHIVIFPQSVKGKRLLGCNLSNVELAGSLEGVDLSLSKLSDSTQIKLLFENNVQEELEKAKELKKKNLIKRK